MIIRWTSFLLIISTMASIALSSSSLTIVVSGLAKICSGSLIATPILLSPTSNPRLPLFISVRFEPGPLLFPELHRFYSYRYHQPEPYQHTDEYAKSGIRRWRQE